MAHLPVSAYGASLCIMLASMIALFAAGDLVLFLLAWELMSLAAFFLVLHRDRDAETRYGAWIYLIATHLGTALCVLPLFAILASRAADPLTGAWSTDLPSIAARIGHLLPRQAAGLFVLGLIGFGTKAGIMPMHVWLPRAHPVSPSPISALMSGMVIKSGIYGLVRLLSIIGPQLPRWCAAAMIAVGVVSGVVGVLYALAQHDLKRLLAYHSVENIGIIALGIGVGMWGQSTGSPTIAALGYAGALLHVLNHALFKALLFLSGGAVIHAVGTGQIDRLGGLARRMPANALLFLVAAVAICGLPPLNGFVSEWLIYGGLFSSIMRPGGALGAAAAVAGLTGLALMGGLALACFAKVFGIVFLGESRSGLLPREPVPASMLIGMAPLAAGCIVIGVAPMLVLPLLAGAVRIAAPGSAFTPATGGVLAPASTITIFAVLLIVLTALLLYIRFRAQRSARIVSGVIPTWGCGFAKPNPRMQYTASSFAWMLVDSFRRVLWPQRTVHLPHSAFPAEAQVHTHTDDVAEHDIFRPLFAALAHLAGAVRTLHWSAEPARACSNGARDQGLRRGPFLAAADGLLAAIRRGSIQVYLLYILATLVAVFAVEAAFTSQPRPRARDAQQPAAVIGQPSPIARAHAEVRP